VYSCGGGASRWAIYIPVTGKSQAISLTQISNLSINGLQSFSQISNPHFSSNSKPFMVNSQIKSTRSSAVAEGPRDASCQLKSCQLPRNSAETTYTTSPDQIDGIKLEI